MPTAENAKIQYESGQDLVAFVQLTDQGDHKDFRSADPLWSNKAGYVPSIKPNGLATGGVVGVAASGSNDVVDVAAGTCCLSGVEETFNASADLSITRPTASHVKYSITITRGQVRRGGEGNGEHRVFDNQGRGRRASAHPADLGRDRPGVASSATPGVIAATEIKQVVGTHCERYDFPTWEQKRSNVASGILGNAGILFNSALPLIHTGLAHRPGGEAGLRPVL